MSTRYVWNRYTIRNTVQYEETKIGEIDVGQEEILYTISGEPAASFDPLYYALVDSWEDYVENPITFPYTVENGQAITIPPRRYLIFSPSKSAQTVQDGAIVYYNSASSTSANVICSNIGGSWSIAKKDTGAFAGDVIQYRATITEQQEKGFLIGPISGPSQSTYPEDGVQGSYWYTYQGSDNIDPASASIPSTINGGTAINITVTPGTGKVYGGTVSYIYQVSLAGGAWTTIATTTATSRSYTVPYGTASIQVRVQAKDNLGFTSTTYVTSSSVTVINNQPPTAPGSIDVTGVVAGQQATITLTAATDPDGTIASYIYERSVDGSAWTQIANVNSLTQTDTISADWGTVAYRACAVDDDGDSGPYVTSSTTVVNSGWVIISGPAADMGSQPKPFTFTITPSISGTTTSDQITVDVTLDGNSIYNEAVAPGTEIELEIDTRLMRTGDHAISVSATCASFLPAANEYSFSVPVITIPDGGRMDQLEGPDGEVIFPITLARAVAGLENYGVESKVHPGAYTGSGTYGSRNPNSLTLEFEPKMVIVQGTSGRMAVMIKPSGVGISIGASDSTTLNVTWDGESVSWYNGVNAANQMNTNNETYSYTAFG